MNSIASRLADKKTPFFGMVVGFGLEIAVVAMFVLLLQGANFSLLGSTTYEWWVLPILILFGAALLAMPFLMAYSSGISRWLRRGVYAWAAIIVVVYAVYGVWHDLMLPLEINLMTASVALMATSAVAYNTRPEKVFRMALLVFVLVGSSLFEPVLSALPLLERLDIDTIRILVVPLVILAIYLIATYVFERKARLSAA